jgi:hypothetical protein
MPAEGYTEQGRLNRMSRKSRIKNGEVEMRIIIGRKYSTSPKETL